MFEATERPGSYQINGATYYSMKVVAEMLNNKKQFGRNKLFCLLREQNIIWGSNNIYPDYRNSFCFEEAQTNGYNPHKTMVFSTLRVSEDGIKLIEKLIANKLNKN